MTTEVYEVAKANTKYEVSNFGNVRKINYNPRNLILKPILLKDSKLYKVNLDIDEGTKSRNRKFKSHLIHRLVAENFMNNFDSKKNVHHKDQNNANNHIENLYQK